MNSTKDLKDFTEQEIIATESNKVNGGWCGTPVPGQSWPYFPFFGRN